MFTDSLYLHVLQPTCNCPHVYNCQDARWQMLTTCGRETAYKALTEVGRQLLVSHLQWCTVTLH